MPFYYKMNIVIKTEKDINQLLRKLYVNYKIIKTEKDGDNIAVEFLVSVAKEIDKQVGTISS